MSASSYLLISSTYRNRLLYPNPADFVVPLGTPNQMINAFDSTNPVSLPLPDYNFSWTNYGLDSNKYPVRIISGSANAPILDPGFNQSFLGIYPGAEVPPSFSLYQESKQCTGVLQGFLLEIRTNTGIVVREIMGYNPIISQLLLRNPLPEFSIEDITESSIYTISDANPSDPEYYPLVIVNGNFLENSAVVYFEKDLYLYNLSLNEIRKVLDYNLVTSSFRFDTCNGFPGSRPTDQYWVLSQSTPLGVGTLLSPYYNQGFPDEYVWIKNGEGYGIHTIVSLENPITGRSIQGLYRITRIDERGGILQMIPVSFTGTTVFPGEEWIVTETTSGNRSARILIRSTALVFYCRFKEVLSNGCDGSGSTWSPGSLPGMVGQYLMPILLTPQYRRKGDSLYVSPNNTIPVRIQKNVPQTLSDSENQWGCTGIRKIFPLDTNKEALVFVQKIDPFLLERFDLLAKAGSSLPSFFSGCLNFLVLPVTMDGVVPLNFTGTQLTQSQMTCYELQVVSLILPNQTINGTQGLLTSAYPYVFVELSNESMSSSHNRSVIYSNNPNSVRATFVCSISDVNNPETTRFIKISSDGASQIMKFSPYDSLRVRITLPDGRPFETDLTDFVLPCDSDPRLQISIVFQMRRL